jgi:group II intron reverse transcriptase/maturase
LMAAVEERISDRHVLKMLRAMLRAGVMEDGQVRHPVTGTPQGGVISPLLCNVYLNQLDRVWTRHCRGSLVRYADDLVVLCATRRGAEVALEVLRRLVGELGLELRGDKTRIVLLEEGAEGLVFLGFDHRWVHGHRQFRHLRFLARWPSRKAMERARDRVRALTDRSRLFLGVERVVEDVNRFLRGWAGYFRYGYSAHAFDKIVSYAKMRVALFIAKLHERPRSFGWAVLYNSPNQLGLISLNGAVVAPRPNKAWREKPNASR